MSKNRNWIFILNPETDNIHLSEPDGWSDVGLQIVRDSKYHGISVSFSDSDLKLNGKAAEFIKAKYEKFGIGADVKIYIAYVCDNVIEFDDTFQLDFGTYKEMCGEQCVVSISFEQAGCMALLNANFDKKVDIETIERFDHSPARVIPTLTEEITLLPRGILKSIEGSVADEGDTINLYSEYHLAFWQMYNRYFRFRPNYGKEIYNAIKTAELIATQQWARQDSRNSFEEYNLVISPQLLWEDTTDCFNTLTIDYRMNGKITIHNLGRVSVKYRLSVQVWKNEFRDYNIVDEKMIGDYWVSGRSSKTIEFDVAKVLTNMPIPKDGYWVMLIVNSNNGNGIFGLESMDVRFEKETYIKIYGNSKCPPSNHKIFYPEETFDRLADVITNGCLTVKSNFYGRPEINNKGYVADGCGALKALTSGLYLRKAPDAKFFMSMKELFEGLAPIDCIGFGYEKNNGQEYLRIESLDYFYQDTEILRLDAVNKVENRISPQDVVGKIRVGYDKWEAEKINGLDEFNSTREYISRVANAKSTFDIMSKFIASGYVIETNRLQSFATSGGADTKFDNETFVISLTRKHIVYGICAIQKESNDTLVILFEYTAFGAYFHHNTPTRIKITGTMNNDGEYTVLLRGTNLFGYLVTDVIHPIPSNLHVENYRMAGVEFLGNTNAPLRLCVEKGADQLTDVYDPLSAINVRLSPVRMLMRWWKWLAGLAFKKLSNPDTEFTFSAGTGNYKMKSFFGDDCAIENRSISEDVTVETTLIKSFESKPKVEAENSNFEYPMSLAQFKQLQANPYGYISYECGNGEWKKAYINKIVLKPTNGIATFDLRNKKE